MMGGSSSEGQGLMGWMGNYKCTDNGGKATVLMVVVEKEEEVMIMVTTTVNGAVM